jgi:hypothetical protein
MKLPRGVRLNNPGNIRHSKDKWQGKAAEQVDTDFVTFESPVWGIRALARLLIRYYDHYELDTVAKIIGRWAPTNENDTDAYVAAVCRKIGVEADESIDVQRYAVMAPLVRAIIDHECGAPKRFGRKEWYPPEIIDEGLRRAGVVPSGKARAKADAEGTALGVGGVGGVGGITYAVMEIREANRTLREHGDETGDPFYLVLPPIITLSAVAVGFYFWRKRKRAERL